MKALPLAIGTIHFVGIGGIGMSGIAEVLHTLEYSVQGSDLSDGANVKRLRDLGIPVHIGHREENLGDAGVVVTSTAVKDANPEVQAARQRLLPVVRRAEMLGELMRLKWSIAVGGTHGKTTTTSLVAHVLDVAGMDPTVINGGIINAWGSNARLGGGDWMVAEADESDGTFVNLPATVAVVTSIDPEHMDHYRSFDDLRDAFDAFVADIPFYGFVALCIDHSEVQAMIPRMSDRRIVTYGFSPQADVRAVNVTTTPEAACFDVHITDRKTGAEKIFENMALSMLGEHNVQNALAAIAVARALAETYPIHEIVGHDDIAPGRKLDPGPAFDMPTFRTQVLGASLRARVTASSLRVRSGPGLDHPVLRALPRGTPVEVTERRRDWIAIAPGQWVFAEHVA